MTARELEEFISVIETAERLARTGSSYGPRVPPGLGPLGSWTSADPASSGRSLTSVSSAYEERYARTSSGWSALRPRSDSNSSRTTVSTARSLATVRASSRPERPASPPWARHPRVVARDLAPAVSQRLRGRPHGRARAPPSSSSSVSRSPQKSGLRMNSPSSRGPTSTSLSPVHTRRGPASKAPVLASPESRPGLAGATRPFALSGRPSPPSSFDGPVVDTPLSASPQKSSTTSKSASPLRSSTTSKSASPLKSSTTSKSASPLRSSTTSKSASPLRSSTTSKSASPLKSSTTSKSASPLKSTTSMAPTPTRRTSPKKSAPPSSSQAQRGTPPTPNSMINTPSRSGSDSGSTGPHTPPWSTQPSPVRIPGLPEVAASLVESSGSPRPLRSPAPSLGSVWSGQEPQLEEPRPVIPLPRPKITIRQSSIRLHDHTQLPESLAPRELANGGVAARRTPGRLKRPISAPPPRRRPPPPVEEIDLRSYSKSLKLLGLNIPSNRVEATQLSHQEVEVRTTSSVLRTRLKGRTQSIANLQELIDSKEKMAKPEYVEIQAPLCQAVFQEWYFKKMGDELQRKRQKEAERQEKEYEKELKEEEKRTKSQEEYRKWLLKKKLEGHRIQTAPVRKSRRAIRPMTEDRKRKIEDKVQEWKDMKTQEEKRRHQAAEARARAKKEQEVEEAKKKEDSQKKFEAWRKSLNEKMRVKMKEENDRALEVLLKKKADAKEKKESAQAAFAYWKKSKVEEEGNRGKKHPQARLRHGDQEKLRRQEAQEAYEKWLEFTEQREIEEKLMVEEQNLRYLWRPPWYPGGIADY